MPTRKAAKRKQTGQVEEGTNKQPRLLNFKELIDLLLLGEPVGEPILPEPIRLAHSCASWYSCMPHGRDRRHGAQRESRPVSSNHAHDTTGWSLRQVLMGYRRPPLSWVQLSCNPVKRCVTHL